MPRATTLLHHRDMAVSAQGYGKKRVYHLLEELTVLLLLLHSVLKVTILIQNQFLV